MDEIDCELADGIAQHFQHCIPHTEREKRMTEQALMMYDLLTGRRSTSPDELRAAQAMVTAAGSDLT